MSVNPFLILGFLIVLTILFGGIKILLGKVFNFDNQRYLWVQYTVYYIFAYGVLIAAGFFFPYTTLFKLFAIVWLLVTEVAVFYFRYYVLDSKLYYAMFVGFTLIVNSLLFQFLFIILGTILSLQFA